MTALSSSSVFIGTYYTLGYGGASVSYCYTMQLVVSVGSDLSFLCISPCKNWVFLSDYIFSVPIGANGVAGVDFLVH